MAMLDNITSISSSSDATTRSTGRAAQWQQSAGQQSGNQEPSGFGQHFHAARQPSANERPSSTSIRPSSDVDRLSGNVHPVDDAARDSKEGEFLPLVQVQDGESGSALAGQDDNLDALLARFSISVEFTQPQTSETNDSLNLLSGAERATEGSTKADESDLDDKTAAAVQRIMTQFFPELEGMPESLISALQNGGLDRLRELVQALDASDDAAEQFEMMAALQQFVDDVVVIASTETPVVRPTTTDLSADERNLLQQMSVELSSVLIEEPSNEQQTLLAAEGNVDEVISEPEKPVITVGAVDVPADSDAPEDTPEVMLAAAQQGFDSTGDGETESSTSATDGRKAGSESTTSTSSANALAKAVTSAGQNTVVTDESTLVRQPMEAAAVRENVARQDTEALIKQHLERELPVRNSASEVTHRLTERLVLMVSRDIQTATIRLDPPDLGKLDIRITTSNEQVQVQVVTHQPVVRDLLEQQAHRLREMLEQQGFAKVDVNVSDQSQQERERAEAGNGTLDGQDEEGENAQATETVRRSVGLVDHYV